MDLVARAQVLHERRTAAEQLVVGVRRHDEDPVHEAVPSFGRGPSPRAQEAVAGSGCSRRSPISQLLAAHSAAGIDRPPAHETRARTTLPPRTAIRSPPASMASTVPGGPE